MCGRAVEHDAAMALMKRSPNRTANWALAMDHARGTALNSAVPGASTWALLLLGFGMEGGAMRFAKRRQMVSVSYA